MEPSLVTWPTRKTGIPVFFDRTMSRSEASLTCPTLPGAEVSMELQTVWMESMTMASGATSFIWVRMFSRETSTRT